jgi:6-phosphogluconate dehydrogenase
MLVPTGAPIDSVISHLLAQIQPGDLIIGAGNFTGLGYRLRFT